MDLICPQQKRSRLFYPLVRSLFSSRRKTLRNTLTAFASSVIINSDIRAVAEDILKRAGISGDARAETLGIDEFSALSAFLEEL
jgi:16S rRNA A1518/A1519 N6-dimethyltransferase RsmA/KsgA/DIM1 with predicted DNA glycosylase/AP lyase activity